MLTVGITGAGGGVGSAILRSLELADLKTRIVCFDSSPDASGLFRGHRARIIPRVTDPRFREAILAACAEEGVQALIPGLDPELEPLAAMAEELRTIGCTVVASSPAVNRLLFEKQLSAEFFAQRGLPFVRTLPLERVEELLDTKGFPLLVKPLSGSASRGVHVVFSTEELKELACDGTSYVVQEYLVPLQWGKAKSALRAEDVYSNHSLVQRDECMVQVLGDRDGEPIGVFASLNTLKDGAVVRMAPFEGDLGGAKAAAMAMAKSLASIGQVGPCNFQSRVTADGPFFYEINPRFSGGTGMRAVLGFNEVEACLRRLVLGEGLARSRACLATRFDRICVMHPSELAVDIPAMVRLDKEGAIDVPGRVMPFPAAGSAGSGNARIG